MPHRPRSHKPERLQRDVYRATAAERGYDRRWRRASQAFLRDHPICECNECSGLGRLRPASVVDHIIPHRGNRERFWDQTNWRAMAKQCHDRKTATEDGGFGSS